jgi:hypothetical protein
MLSLGGRRASGGGFTPPPWWGALRNAWASMAAFWSSIESAIASSGVIEMTVGSSRSVS